MNKSKIALYTILSILCVGLIIYSICNGRNSSYNLRNGGVYIKDDVCMLHSTDVRSEKEMRDDTEQCIQIRKSLKKE